MSIMRSWMKCCTQVATATIGLVLVMKTLPAQAAEKITIAYDLLEFSVPIASLERFANQGQIDSELREYTQYLKQPQVEQLRQVLARKVPLSAVDVSRLSNSSFGQEALSFIGNIIQTGPEQNGMYALRSALVLAADPQGFTMLDVIRKFPAPTLRINSVNLIELMEEFNRLETLNQRVTNLVIQESQKSTSRPLSNTALPARPQKWHKENLSLLDSQRQRRFAADLYQPDSQKPAPLLVISPGLASNRSESIFVELAEHLVAHGFAVAVIEHPNSNSQQLENLLQGLAREVMEPSEFIDRPRDVSYLLNELERRNRLMQWRGRIDLKQVGVMGHSFGGYTALALVGGQMNFANLRQICAPRRFDLAAANVSLILQCEALKLPERIYQLQDQRIQSAFIFNPVGSAVFGETGLRQIRVPIMMVSGSKDELTSPLLEQVCPFTWLKQSPKYLAMIQGGTHNYASPRSKQNRLFTLLGSDQADPTLAKDHLKSLSLKFFQAHIQPKSSNRISLAVTLPKSDTPFALHLIQNLNTESVARSIKTTCPSAQLSKGS